MLLRRLMFGLLLTACGAAQTTTPQHFQISGTVVHGITGQPLPRAEVAIGIAEHEGVLRGTVTDEQGHFVFPDLKHGKYWLAARKRGFPRQGYQQHEDYWTGIAVGTGVSSEGIVFPLAPGASIAGTITTSESETVPDSQVLLFRSGVSYGRRRTVLVQQDRPDDMGRYHFSHLLPGTYFLAVSAQPWYMHPVYAHSVQLDAGTSTSVADDAIARRNSQFDLAYPVTFFPGVTDSTSATPISLKPGERVSADVMLSAVPSLHVRVRSMDPDANYATFTQFLFGTYPITLPTASSALPSGEVEISGLTPGQFTATIQSSGENSGTRSQSVNLSGDGEIDAARTSPATLTGVVRLGTDSVPSGTVIRLWNIATDQTLEATVGESGKFEFSEAVVPGNYQILAFNVPNAEVGRVSATGAEVAGTTVRITRVGDVHLVIELTQGLARIEGTALKDGKPSPQTMILLVPDDFERNPAAIRRDQSDSDGTFVLRFALPGNYTIVAIPDGWNLEWQNPQVLRPYLGRGERLQVAANQKYRVKVQVQ